MIITIASGKGGTGKTTVATNLALSLGDAQLIDCDVEEPNSNIFLQTSLETLQDITVSYPDIDSEHCTYCGACSEFCAYNALAIVPNNALVFPELCHSCGGCKIVCPHDAIAWKTRSIGTISHGHRNTLDFLQGELHVGEQQAIPLIKHLKHHIDTKHPVLLDSPPGTSCPVIETATGSDYVLLVTEPTPFGLHDLKLAVDVMRHLQLPFGVIINRDGIGDSQVQDYCQQEHIPILLKIPHDETIAQLYSQGIPFVTEYPEWKDKFLALYARIQQEVHP